MVPRVAVDLARAPGERWAELRLHVDGARRLVDNYLRDLGEARGSVAALIELVMCPYTGELVVEIPEPLTARL